MTSSTSCSPLDNARDATVPTVRHDEQRPIFVDLDGTLISTDLLFEGFLRSVKQSPVVLLMTPFWIKQGLASFKQRIVGIAPFDPSTLPYRDALIAHLIAERARGRSVILATASPEQWARPVAEYLDCFDDVIASDATHNRKSSEKLLAIREWCQQHDLQTFDYYGDSAADRKIWRASQIAFLVGSGSKFRAELTLDGITCEEIATRTAGKSAYLRLLNPTAAASCWLVAVPLLATNSMSNAALVVKSGLATGAFAVSLIMASVVRDLFSIEQDRADANSRLKPFAAGLIPIPKAVALITVSCTAALLVTVLMQSWSCAGILISHLILGFASAIWCGRRRICDAFSWTLLCGLQLLAGGLAIDQVMPREIAIVAVFLLAFVALLRGR